MNKVLTPQTETTKQTIDQNTVNDELVKAIRYLASDNENIKAQIMTISLLIDYLIERIQKANIDLDLDSWPEWAQKRNEEMRKQAEEILKTRESKQETQEIDLNE